MEENRCEGYTVNRPKPKERRKGTLGLWPIPPIFLGVLLSLFVYRSTRPQMRLAADPPAKFLVGRPDWGAKRREAEQRIARAYWDCAVEVIQWRYSYGSILPPTPPAEFRADVGTLPKAAAAAPESRDYYWQRLRAVWPVAWKEVYGWETGWFFEPLKYSWSRVVKGL